jgi:hypothetical protein
VGSKFRSYFPLRTSNFEVPPREARWRARQDSNLWPSAPEAAKPSTKSQWVSYLLVLPRELATRSGVFGFRVNALCTASFSRALAPFGRGPRRHRRSAAIGCIRMFYVIATGWSETGTLHSGLPIAVGFARRVETRSSEACSFTATHSLGRLDARESATGASAPRTSSGRR